MQRDTVLLAGGGTGGHVFPMIAVADELKRRLPNLDLVFVGTERGVETQVVPEKGYRLELLDIEPIRGRGAWGALKGARRAVASLGQARELVRCLEPKVVFSIGGYAAGPVSLAARSLGVPLALMEPNSVIGLANRLIAPFVQRAYTTFPQVERHFAAGCVLRTGLALRRGFEPRPYNYHGGTLNVLVLGGSQGAQSLNETVPHALSRCRAPLTVLHQAGKGNDGAVRQLYQSLGARGRQVHVEPFISDMPSTLANADLVIGRSGAGALAEICAIGRPALFIPYPYASGDHQYVNASVLVEQGAAVCLRSQEATVERLTAELDQLMESPDRLRQMAVAAQRLGKPDAAEVVAQDLMELGNLPLDVLDDEAPEQKLGNGGDDTPVPSEVH